MCKPETKAEEPGGQPDHTTGLFPGTLSLSLMYLKHLVLSSLKKKGGTVIPLECQGVSVYSKACTPTSSPFRPLSYNHALINTVNLSLYAFRNTGTHMHLWQNEG